VHVVLANLVQPGASHTVGGFFSMDEMITIGQLFGLMAKSVDRLQTASKQHGPYTPFSQPSVRLRL